MKKYILAVSLFVNVLFLALVIRHYVLLPTNGAKSNPNYFVNRDILLRMLPTSVDDIVFVGDSHTQNFELPEFFNNRNVKNRGIFYDTTTGVKSRINEIANGHPAEVFIEIGVNDLRLGIELNTIRDNMISIVKTLTDRSPETKIYIQSVLPVGKGYENADSINKIRERLNKIYILICSQYKITYVDLDYSFLTNKYLSSKYDVGDHIHLNYYGYLKWSEILMPYLKQK